MRESAGWLLPFVLPFLPNVSAATAPPLMADTFSLDQLEKALDRAPPRDFTALLDLLPPEIFKNPVLMRESRSLQSASPNSPRVLLSTESGSFIAAFNGNPLSAGGDALEMVQFHSETSRFEFAEVKFVDGRPGELHRNVISCAGCHGSIADPRPNWESFPAWPGAYGAGNEVLTEIERSDLVKFIDSAAAHPRYGYLKGLAESHLARDGEKRMVGRPNSTLNLNLNRLNSRRIARLVDENARPAADSRARKISVLATLVCPTPSARAFVADFFPERSDEDYPTRFSPFESDAAVDHPSAFFWSVVPNSAKRFFWTLSFGDMMNKAAVRTRESATEDLVQSLIADDANFLGTGPITCERLEAMRR